MKKLKLDQQQKDLLIRVVRDTIEAHLENRESDFGTLLSDEVFSQQFGLFVTLTVHSELRGCIGYIEGVKPLRDAIQEMAVQAAFHDPRFYPLTSREYKDIKVEISILYPLEEVKDVLTIEVGRHGLVMERDYHKGLLLPQVAVDHHWDREHFLNETCRKAGMETFCWENGARVSSFEAEVFGEPQVHH